MRSRTANVDIRQHRTSRFDLGHLDRLEATVSKPCVTGFKSFLPGIAVPVCAFLIVFQLPSRPANRYYREPEACRSHVAA